jgi:hypothetical protein
MIAGSVRRVPDDQDVVHDRLRPLHDPVDDARARAVLGEHRRHLDVGRRIALVEVLEQHELAVVGDAGHEVGPARRERHQRGEPLVRDLLVAEEGDVADDASAAPRR